MISIPEAKIIFTFHNRGCLYYMGIKAFNHLPSCVRKLLGNKINLKILEKTTIYLILFIH